MKYLAFVFLILNSIITMAIEAGDPGLPGDDPDLPVDGGIALLLIAGAAYGVSKINQLRNR